ncbi:hypothetical protein LMG9585_22400, partial [Xanthomonas oryzae pv. oryzae]
AGDGTAALHTLPRARFAYGKQLPWLKDGANQEREKAEIDFWDESGFRADAVQGRTWAVKGVTPVVAVPGQRQ